jgi:hypothetical protein
MCVPAMHTKGDGLKTDTRIWCPRETLEERLKKTPRNARYFRTRLFLGVLSNIRKFYGHRTWC